MAPASEWSRFRARLFEEHAQGFGGFAVVVHDQDAARRKPLRTHHLAARLRVLGGHGQPYEELAAGLVASASCFNRPAMQLHEAANQRQTDPEPSLRAAVRSIDLREHVEHAREV